MKSLAILIVLVLYQLHVNHLIVPVDLCQLLGCRSIKAQENVSFRVKDIKSYHCFLSERLSVIKK